MQGFSRQLVINIQKFSDEVGDSGVTITETSRLVHPMVSPEKSLSAVR